MSFQVGVEALEMLPNRYQNCYYSISIDFGGVTQVTPFFRQKISDPVKILENEKTK